MSKWSGLVGWAQGGVLSTVRRISAAGVYIVVGLSLWAYSTVFFFGSWVPWGVAVGLVLGFIALFLDVPEATEEDTGARVSEPYEATQALAGYKQDLPENLLLGFMDDPKLKEFMPLKYAGENHVITFGKPGSGKGTQVIIPNLLAVPTSCIVIDPKGQNAAITARARGELGNRVFILNPYNVLPAHLDNKGKQVINCARYNPLDRIDPESVNFVGDVGSLAQSLIVYQGGDTHWADAGRELVAALIMHVCMDSDPETRNLGYVRALLNQDARGFALTLADMIRGGFPPLVQKAVQFAGDTNEIKSIISAARTQLAFLDDPSICDALATSDFRFADMKREAITVYLVLPFKQIEAQARWLRLLITSAIEELTEEPQPGDKRVLFMLDEFAQLGRLHAVERALALVRGYGVQLWPFLQDLPQLKSVYPDRWESFLATAGVVQFFTPNDNTTAEYVSQRCGVHLVKRKTFSESSGERSSSQSTSTADHWEPLFRPWELYGEKIDKGKIRERHKQLVFVERLSPVVCSFPPAPYYRASYGPKNFDPDPFHLPAPQAPAPAPEQIDGAQASV